MSDCTFKNPERCPRLYASAEELDVPPVPFLDGDLSRIRVIAPATIEAYEALRAERDAAREAHRDGQGADPALAALLAGVS